MPTTYGSVVFKDFIPMRDATIVTKLKQAGAVIVAKTTMGLELMARAFSEPLLLKLAFAYEQGTRHRRPPVSTPPLPHAGDRR
jgi:Asp-tRNA(Asn)/Glu-tRNA(Gln) amidotransferase A subunit family amidase